MAITPDVQEKAQTEIDRVIGRNRLPEIYDRPKLPYLEGIYREVLRCKPALHLGGPHSLTEDDYYKGYFIPKGWLLFLKALDYYLQGFLDPMILGTTVFGNIWRVFLTHFFHEYWRKFQGPWHTTKVYSLILLFSNLKDTLTKMECPTTTGY